MSIGDDELGTVTPTRFDAIDTVKTRQLENEKVAKVDEIEIVKNPPRKTSFKRETSVESHKSKETGANEIEYKREGSLAPSKKQDPNKIWGKAVSKSFIATNYI